MLFFFPQVLSIYNWWNTQDMEPTDRADCVFTFTVFLLLVDLFCTKDQTQGLHHARKVL